MEAWLLAQQIEMEAIKAEIQGMIAMNRYRMDRTEAIVYSDDAFQKKADELRCIATCIMQKGGE